MASWWRKAGLAAATVAAFVTAASLTYLGRGLPALVALIAGIATGGLVLAVVLRRIGDTLAQSRTTTRLLQQLQRSSADAGIAGLDLAREVESDVKLLRGQLELATHSIKEGTAQSERMLRSMRARLDESLADAERRARGSGDAHGGTQARSVDQMQSDTLQEVEALLRLRDEYPLRFESPLLSNFALSPRGMWQVVKLVREKQPSTIVELGSGLSTLYLSRCVSERLGPIVYSLEHALEYLESTRQLLDMHGATDDVRLIHAPLVDTPMGGRTFSWYQLPDRLPDEIGLLIVDGPPGGTGKLARLPAVGCLIERLQPGAVIVLDDAHREDEREIARVWVRDFGLRRCHSLTPQQIVLERPPVT